MILYTKEHFILAKGHILCKLTSFRKRSTYECLLIIRKHLEKQAVAHAVSKLRECSQWMQTPRILGAAWEREQRPQTACVRRESGAGCPRLKARASRGPAWNPGHLQLPQAPGPRGSGRSLGAWQPKGKAEQTAQTRPPSLGLSELKARPEGANTTLKPNAISCRALPSSSREKGRDQIFWLYNNFLK